MLEWFLYVTPAFVGLLYFLFKLSKRDKNKHSKPKIQTDKNTALKYSGVKVKIDLNDVEFTSNSWTDTEYNQVHSYYTEEVKVSRNKVLCKFKFIYLKNELEHLITLPFELKTLQMHFAIKEYTYIYLNANNIEDRYLDLEFLK